MGDQVKKEKSETVKVGLAVPGDIGFLEKIASVQVPFAEAEAVTQNVARPQSKAARLHEMVEKYRSGKLETTGPMTSEQAVAYIDEMSAPLKDTIAKARRLQR